jgi:metal-sulfur cluster biosynthetic enzyme
MNAKPGTNRPVWEVESTDPELAERTKKSLEQVIDPEIGLSIIQLGLVRDVKVKPEAAVVRMILTTPYCPYGPAMIETTRQKAMEALNRPVSVDLGMEMWDFSMMEEDSAPDWLMY